MFVVVNFGRKGFYVKVTPNRIGCLDQRKSAKNSHHIMTLCDYERIVRDIKKRVVVNCLKLTPLGSTATPRHATLLLLLGAILERDTTGGKITNDCCGCRKLSSYNADF